MTFTDLETRLLERLNRMVRRGEISERRLAKLTGFTQPHIHNVLKGARRLRAGLADALLAGVEMPLEELLPAARDGAGVVEVPVWRGVVGPRHRFPEGTDPVGYRLFPAAFLGRFHRPVLLRAGPEEYTMAPMIEPDDLLLIDRADAARRRPVLDGVYVVAFNGRGAVCRCQVVGDALVLVADNVLYSSRLPDHLPLARRDVLEIIRGRVVWVARELDLV